MDGRHKSVSSSLAELTSREPTEGDPHHTKWAKSIYFLSDSESSAQLSVNSSQ